MTAPNVTVGKKWSKGAVYIGRPTVFGNPFPIPSGGAEHLRDSACDAYDKHFWEHWLIDPLFVSELEGLVSLAQDQGHLTLGCFCRPAKRCHGDTIKEYVDRRLAGTLQRPTPPSKVGLKLRDLI